MVGQAFLEERDLESSFGRGVYTDGWKKHLVPGSRERVTAQG